MTMEQEIHCRTRFDINFAWFYCASMVLGTGASRGCKIPKNPFCEHREPNFDLLRPLKDFCFRPTIGGGTSSNIYASSNDIFFAGQMSDRQCLNAPFVRYFFRGIPPANRESERGPKLIFFASQIALFYCYLNPGLHYQGCSENERQ